MTYQLLNENYVPARNLKNTKIRNVIFFFMFIFDISFNIGIYKIVPPASCSATLYPEFPVIVWFTARAEFLKSLVFSVGIRRFKVRGVVYSYQTI